MGVGVSYIGMRAEQSGHMINFISNVKQVDQLADIHLAVAGSGPGRKYNVEILHKSAVVLLVACWESFVEDLASNALSSLIDNASDSMVVPEDVRERISAKLSGPRAWELAGDGWRQVCRDHLKDVLGRTVGSLNTPRSRQVDELFHKIIGLENLSGQWSWRGRSAAVSRSILDNLITLRGSIAHRVTTARRVRKVDVIEAREFVSRLAVRSHNAVNGFICERIGKSAWEGYWYNETR